jgi:hypothetical protein
MISENTKYAHTPRWYKMPLTPQVELHQIDDINFSIQQKGMRWIAGKTSVSDLSIEAKALLCGTFVGPPTPGTRIISYPVGVQDTSQIYFSWDNIGGTSDGLGGINWMTPVRTQRCGDCWAYGAIGIVEAAYNIYTDDPNRNLDLSEQHLVSDGCDAGDCGGGWQNLALDCIHDFGVTSEECFPYMGHNSACTPCGLWPGERYNIYKYAHVSPSVDNYKSALIEYGPLSVTIDLIDGEDFFFYTSGVYEPTFSSQEWTAQIEADQNHAIIIVGWDEEQSAWIIKNSWGEGWGIGGYGLVAYGYLEYSGADVITGIVEPDDPNDIWITPLSVTATSTQLSSTDEYIPENTIDGLLDTHWYSKQFVTDATLTYDFGELLTLDGIRMIINEWIGPGLIDVSTSTNGSTWNPVAQERFVDGGEYFIKVSFPKDTVQYVRIREHGFDRRYCSLTEFDARLTSDNVAPTAHISVKYVSPAEVPATIQFTGEGTDLDGTIISYEWEFGDDTSNSNEQSPVHVYDTPDVYVIVLTVTDNDGAIDTDIAHVRVRSSGTCELLLHYDDDDDGIISYDEIISACSDMMAGIITDEEYTTVISARNAGSIDNFIKGCYVQTFTKGFTVDGVLHSDSTVTLLTGETTNLFAGVYLDDIGKYEICTYTEVIT